jgi:ankyrin repeat protein
MAGIFGNDQDKANAIYLAAKRDDLDELEKAINKIILPNKKKKILNMTSGDNGETPLFIASRYGHLPVVEALLSHRADVNKGRTDI